MSNKAFFDDVRGSLFGGRLKQHQVEGLDKIIKYGLARSTPREHLAYVLATAYHETGRWMQPIREGALRYGPNYSDASAKRAVASIYAKGIIRRNYALAAGPWKQSYYGRGLVQITWYDNYLKLGREIGLGEELAKNPDRALEWDVALSLLFVGMEKGLYRNKSLDDYDLPAQFVQARDIINGDVRKNGPRIAREARHFYDALESLYANPPAPAREPDPKPEPQPVEEDREERSSGDRSDFLRWLDRVWHYRV